MQEPIWNRFDNTEGSGTNIRFTRKSPRRGLSDRSGPGLPAGSCPRGDAQAPRTNSPAPRSTRSCLPPAGSPEPGPAWLPRPLPAFSAWFLGISPLLCFPPRHTDPPRCSPPPAGGIPTPDPRSEQPVKGKEEESSQAHGPFVSHSHNSSLPRSLHQADSLLVT